MPGVAVSARQIGLPTWPERRSRSPERAVGRITQAGRHLTHLGLRWGGARYSLWAELEPLLCNLVALEKRADADTRCEARLLESEVEGALAMLGPPAR